MTANQYLYLGCQYIPYLTNTTGFNLKNFYWYYIICVVNKSNNIIYTLNDVANVNYGIPASFQGINDVTYLIKLVKWISDNYQFSSNT